MAKTTIYVCRQCGWKYNPALYVELGYIDAFSKTPVHKCRVEPEDGRDEVEASGENLLFNEEA